MSFTTVDLNSLAKINYRIFSAGKSAVILCPFALPKLIMFVSYVFNYLRTNLKQTLKK